MSLHLNDNKRIIVATSLNSVISVPFFVEEINKMSIQNERIEEIYFSILFNTENPFVFFENEDLEPLKTFFKGKNFVIYTIPAGRVHRNNIPFTQKFFSEVLSLCKNIKIRDTYGLINASPYTARLLETALTQRNEVTFITNNKVMISQLSEELDKNLEIKGPDANNTYTFKKIGFRKTYDYKYSISNDFVKTTDGVQAMIYTIYPLSINGFCSLARYDNSYDRIYINIENGYKCFNSFYDEENIEKLKLFFKGKELVINILKGTSYTYKNPLPFSELIVKDVLSLCRRVVLFDKKNRLKNTNDAIKLLLNAISDTNTLAFSFKNHYISDTYPDYVLEIERTSENVFFSLKKKPQQNIMNDQETVSIPDLMLEYPNDETDKGPTLEPVQTPEKEPNQQPTTSCPQDKTVAFNVKSGPQTRYELIKNLFKDREYDNILITLLLCRKKEPSFTFQDELTNMRNLFKGKKVYFYIEKIDAKRDFPFVYDFSREVLSSCTEIHLMGDLRNFSSFLNTSKFLYGALTDQNKLVVYFEKDRYSALKDYLTSMCVEESRFYYENEEIISFLKKKDTFIQNVVEVPEQRKPEDEIILESKPTIEQKPIIEETPITNVTKTSHLPIKKRIHPKTPIIVIDSDDEEEITLKKSKKEKEISIDQKYKALEEFESSEHFKNLKEFGDPYEVLSTLAKKGVYVHL